MTTLTANELVVTGGVDTHQDLHVAATLDQSGQTRRHRLNRAGDRHANAARWRIVIVRPTCDQRTHDDIARRQAEGKSKTEAIRCLKRYVAREVFNAMPSTTVV